MLFGLGGVLPGTPTGKTRGYLAPQEIWEAEREGQCAGLAVQIGFQQEDFLHFCLGWTLHTQLKASAGMSLHKMNLRRNSVLLPRGLDLQSLPV